MSAYEMMRRNRRSACSWSEAVDGGQGAGDLRQVGPRFRHRSGETIAEDRFLILHGNETMADLPLSKLASSAPEFDPPVGRDTRAARGGPGARGRPHRRARGADLFAQLLLESWVYEQYDHMVMAETVVPPGLGAGVVRGAWHRQGAGLHLGRDAALRQGEPGRGRQAGRGRSPGATCAPWVPGLGRDRQPELRQSREARDHGPARRRDQRPSARLRRARHADRVGAMSASTTRPMAWASCRRRPSGRLGLLDHLDDLITGVPRSGDILLLLGETRGILGSPPAGRGLQPRGWRRAAGRSGRGTPRRAFSLDNAADGACTDERRGLRGPSRWRRRRA